MEKLAESGSLEDLDVPAWVKTLFRVSHDITPEWHVKMQAAFQSHTDNSVSKTINFPNHATREDVAEAYLLAYETNCKGITVYRDGSKDDQVLSTGGTGKSVAAPTEAAELDELVDMLHPAPSRVTRERPRQIHGITERVRTGHGNMYVTINFDEGENPFEVFGTLGKSGGCDSAQLEAISRLVSLALRSGIEPRRVIDQLRGITCCPVWDQGILIRSGPDAVALALERSLIGEGEDQAALPESESVQLQFTAQPVENSGRGNGNGKGDTVSYARKCPECNTPVIFQEGCHMCVSCGWNKCE